MSPTYGEWGDSPVTKKPTVKITAEAFIQQLRDKPNTVSRATISDFMHEHPSYAKMLAEELVEGWVRYLKVVLPYMYIDENNYFLLYDGTGKHLLHTTDELVGHVMAQPSNFYTNELTFSYCVGCGAVATQRTYYLKPAAPVLQHSLPPLPRVRFSSRDSAVISRLSLFRPWPDPRYAAIAIVCKNCAFKCNACGMEIHKMLDVELTNSILSYGECHICMTHSTALTKVEPPKLGRRELRTVAEKIRRGE